MSAVPVDCIGGTTRGGADTCFGSLGAEMTMGGKGELVAVFSLAEFFSFVFSLTVEGVLGPNDAGITVLVGVGNGGPTSAGAGSGWEYTAGNTGPKGWVSDVLGDEVEAGFASFFAGKTFSGSMV